MTYVKAQMIEIIISVLISSTVTRLMNCIT